MQFNINNIPFEQIPEKIVEIGEKLAEYTAQYEHLENMTKVHLSRNAWGKEWSEATRQRLAYAETLFEWHLDGLKVAREQMLKHRAYLQALEAKQEYCRSLNALERAKANLR